ncbi:MAG: hypothetical protein PHE59_02335 [Patescibacteria group bacterium]|nr:hypothetical protein [Patescibacteria group bacterium]MDD5164650.1 hypothetical protein [Patescibacteria group bacterium]MDD5534824.1 hypothetical protein [Patescibacteria group bacterium]
MKKFWVETWIFCTVVICVTNDSEFIKRYKVTHTESYKTAYGLLEHLRLGGVPNYDDQLNLLRKELTKGGLTLKDIRTSEEELDILRICENSIIANQKWLDSLRQKTNEKIYKPNPVVHYNSSLSATKRLYPHWIDYCSLYTY